MNFHDRPTIQTIADELGVHRSTVSRALNPEQAHLIGEDTVQRVHEVAERLGWEANPWARSLSTNRSLTLGLVIPRLSDVVLATIFEAAEDEARQHGYQAVTVSTHDEPAEERRLTDHLLDRRVDGVLLATAHLEDRTPDYLESMGVPFVLLNRAQGQHLCVRGDDELGGYLVTRHLISQGHTRIGMVAGPRTVSTSVGRVDGYRRAHREAGLEIDDQLIVESTFRARSGAPGAAALLSLSAPPSAIFAVNDMTAIGVMSAARDLGLQIPRDLALVGYNDSDIASLLPVALSSVSLPLREMGETAIDMLLAVIRGESQTSEVLTPRLIVRDSSQRERVEVGQQ